MKPVVYLVQDLVFVAKIREAAERLGVPVARARDPEALRDAARDARLVLVDLRLPAALRALELLAADPAAAAVPSVGFVGHEELAVMQEATARGCGQVLAKGQFAAQIPRLLAPA
jgi:DNA-binding NtrC family response regulator